MLELTVQIVSAYVGNHSVGKAELLFLIAQTHMALARGAPSADPPETQKPSVSIIDSVTPEYLICLEDGRRFRSLRRHLRSDHGISPDEYRVKWNLLPDYPMVAPAYAKMRSQFAKQSGLGKTGSRS
jgi:predicted transcriptional regulator